MLQRMTVLQCLLYIEIKEGTVGKATCRWERARRGSDDRRLTRGRELSRAVTLPWGLRKRRFTRVLTAPHGSNGQGWLTAES